MRTLTLIILIALVSCKKDAETEPKPQELKWAGIYHSIDLANDSTGAVVDLLTHINILSSEGDSVCLSAVIDEYGACYFYNVPSNQDTGNGVILWKGFKAGNVATMDNRSTWINAGQRHLFLYATLTQNSDGSITLKYGEVANGKVKTYTGHFVK